MKQYQLKQLEASLAKAREADSMIPVEAEALRWLLACHSKINRRALPVRGPDGEVYVSQTALAHKLGVRQSTIANRLNTLGTMEGYGTTNGKLGNTNARALPVRIGGLYWPSIYEYELKGAPDGSFNNTTHQDK